MWYTNIVLYICEELAVLCVPSQGGPASDARAARQHGLAAGHPDAGRAAASALRGAPRQRRRQLRPGAAALARAPPTFGRVARFTQRVGEGNVCRYFYKT